MSAQKVVDACEKHWEAHKADCSGFVKAVAGELGVQMVGDADSITATIQSAGWTVLKDGAEAQAKADLGWLVIGGLKGKDHSPARSHGHVVIVVTGTLAQGKYPTAYWGSLGGSGKKKQTLNWSWNKTDRDNVIYAGRAI